MCLASQTNEARKKCARELKERRGLSFGDKQTIKSTFWLARKEAKASRTLENTRLRHVSRFARDDNDRSLSVISGSAVGLLFVMYLVPFLAFIGSGSWRNDFEFSLQGLHAWPHGYSTLFYSVLGFTLWATMCAGAFAAGMFARENVSSRVTQPFRTSAMIISAVLGGAFAGLIGRGTSLAMFVASAATLKQ